VARPELQEDRLREATKFLDCRDDHLVSRAGARRPFAAARLFERSSVGDGTRDARLDAVALA
jgi:hypothetical protein